MLLSYKTFETETFGKKSGFSFRAPTTCSVRRLAFPTFTCVTLSYSSPGSFAVTLLAIVCGRVLLTAITLIYRLSSRPVYLKLTLSLFVGECKGSGTRFFTPRAAWSLPHLRLISLVSVSIATVKASIPQSGPRLRFGAAPLVPCPLAFQPNPDSVRYVAEQTLISVYL